MQTAIQFDRPCPLLIVTVNYRTADLVIESLRSLVLEIETVPGTRVVVVDNPSGDDSVAKIGAAIAAEGWGDWAEVVASDRNGGYAYGNNFAIRPALASNNPPPYFLLLNPDTQVRPGALKALLDFMQQRSDVGICGSSFEEADGSPWHTAFRFPTLMSEMEDGIRLGIVSKVLARWRVSKTMTQEQQPIDWLPGASMMIRREVFDEIGLMDEGYFLYFEETDFCLQAKRAGWSCWYVPESRVMHIAGQSTGVTVRSGPPKRLPQYWFDSRRRYFTKNHGVVYAAFADVAWMGGFALWRLRRIVQRKPDMDPPQLLSDFFHNSVFFKPPAKLT
jgi:GT2 family glycosyltransferase